MKKLGITAKVTLVLTAVVVVISCAVNPVTGKNQLVLMSESQEIAQGAQYDPQVVAQFGVYKDDPLLAFVQGKTTEMGKVSHRPNLEYHVKVLDTPVVNAFAVPGGYIYLTRGILAQLNNEAELAGIIGHEMGHINARHSLTQQAKQQVGQILVMGGALASKKFAAYANYALSGMQLLYLKFSRDDERQADQLGAIYSTRVGYDAHKMADFFKTLYKMQMAEEQSGVPTFLSTHPDPGDRYNTVNKYATKLQDSIKPGNKWLVNGDSYLNLVNGIVYGADPRQGYVEGNTFYQPEMKFKFSFPTGWALENQPSQVNIAPTDGNALIIFGLSSQSSIADAEKSTAESLSLKTQQSKNVTVNGLSAIEAISKQASQNSSTGAVDTNMVLSYYINYNNSCMVFHGVASKDNFKNFSDKFKSTMQSFDKLTDPSKINVKPKKLLVKKAPKAGTLSDTFTALGVKKDDMANLALLNEMELTDNVAAGKLIKVIGE